MVGHFEKERMLLIFNSLGGLVSESVFQEMDKERCLIRPRGDI